MPAQVTTTVQQWIDSVPVDFKRNLEELEKLYTRFVTAFLWTTMSASQRQSVLAYQEFRAGGFLSPAHFLGFHQAVHLAGHGGQIRTIRNLYRRTRGEPGRFFPDNLTFPTLGNAQPTA